MTLAIQISGPAFQKTSNLMTVKVVGKKQLLIQQLLEESKKSLNYQRKEWQESKQK
jgi:hypothetical protein